MIQCVIALLLLIAVPSPATAQTLAQIVEGAKAEKELLTYATTQAPVMNRLSYKDTNCVIASSTGRYGGGTSRRITEWGGCL